MDIDLNLDKNIKVLNDKLGVGKTFDINYRYYEIGKRRVSLYYISGLVENLEIIAVMKKLITRVDVQEDFFDFVYNQTAHQDVKILLTIEEVINSVLNGIIVLLFNECKKALGIATRNYPTRSIAEPDTEKVIRGSHDGFTENFALNIALIRRRIKDGNLRNEIYQIGYDSPTYVCLSYIEGICDNEVVKDIQARLQKVKPKHLIMTDKALEELLVSQKFNPYPLVRYTERADIVSVHLYQGSFAIFVDTSPSVILAPATIFDHMTHAEEYRQTPLAGTYLRFIRYLGIFLSLFLTPIWLLLVKNNVDLGATFSILNPDEQIKVAIFLQILAAEVGIEFLRMASIHTPNALSTAMGLVAGILIGDIAIKVGVFSIQTVFLVAISAIGTYVTPSYELGLANKLSKLVFLIVIYFFNWVGFIVAFVSWFAFLATRKSFKRGYLYPIIPFNFRELKKVLFRYSYKEEKNAKTKM